MVTPHHMRRIHEIALAVGIVFIWAALSRRIPFPSPFGYIVGVIVVISFLSSTVLALTLALRPRQSPLAVRTVFSYLLSAAGLSFLIMAGVNDLWIALSYSQRFLLLASLLCALFVVPWVFTDFRILHRTPLAFDAALTPFLAGLLPIASSSLPLSIFWDLDFWAIFGLPTVLITYFAMRAACRRGRSTLVPLAVCTALLAFILLAISHGCC